MASEDKLKRHILIVRLLRRKASTLEEIQNYLDYESEIHGGDYSISARTFSRDILAIASSLNIEIEYNRSSGKYEIISDYTDDIMDKMIEAYNIFNALNMQENLEKCLHMESSRPSGTEYLYPLIKAIRNKKEVRIKYAKFDTKAVSQRLLQPYGIKEFRNWWFLLAKDSNDGVLKNFAFDRIQELNVTTKEFEKDPDFDINKYYQHSFGVTVLPDKEPQEVVLAIYDIERNYVKAMPYHSSQEIIEENENRLIIKIYTYITWELVAELRSKGSYIEVLSPQSLRDSLFNIKYYDQF